MVAWIKDIKGQGPFRLGGQVLTAGWRREGRALTQPRQLQLMPCLFKAPNSALLGPTLLMNLRGWRELQTSVVPDSAGVGVTGLFASLLSEVE